MSATALSAHLAAPRAAGSLLLLRASGRAFAVPIGCAQSVFRIETTTRLPGAPDCVLGLVNLRGQIVPLTSLALRLDPNDKAGGSAPLGVVFDWGGRSIAAAVESVGDVVQAGGEDIVPPPPTIDPALTELVVAVLRRGRELIPVLDIAALFEFPVKSAEPATRRLARETA